MNYQLAVIDGFKLYIHVISHGKTYTFFLWLNDDFPHFSMSSHYNNFYYNHKFKNNTQFFKL